MKSVGDKNSTLCHLAGGALHLDGVGAELFQLNLERADLSPEPVTLGLLARILLPLKIIFGFIF